MEQQNMRTQIFIGADHRGFKLAEALMIWGKDNNFPFFSLGATGYDKNDDYVDYAKAVGERVRNEIVAKRPAMGIVICGSGVGADIVANKTLNIRCCLGYNNEQIRRARNDDDVNVLALGAEYIDIETAKEFVLTFMSTPFNDQEERYTRRLKKIENLTIM